MSTRRSLSYGDLAYETTSVKWLKPPGGSWYVQKTQDFETHSDYYSHVGEDTPDFHKRLKKGHLIPLTSWRQDKVEGGIIEAKHDLTAPDGSQSYWTNYRPLLVSSQYLISSPDLAANYDLDKLQNIARERVQAASASIAGRGWDALTFLAELHKTVALFRGFIPRLIEVIRRGRLDRAWLESRYGWRILLYDIEDINKLIKKINSAAKESKFAKQRVGTSLSDVITSTLEYSDSSGTRYYDRIDTFDISVRGNVIAVMKPPPVRFNVLVTAWEITRFSFLIDWIIDVGQWLDAMQFLLLQSGYSAAGGLHVKMTRSVKLGYQTWNSGWSGDSSFESESAAEFTRRIPMRVPMAPLWKVDLDWLKVGDLLALLIGFLKR